MSLREDLDGKVFLNDNTHQNYGFLVVVMLKSQIATLCHTLIAVKIEHSQFTHYSSILKTHYRV